jgi:thiamine kinase-like enzyme
MTPGPPSDHEVVACLEGALGDARVARLERAPYPYATSYPLEDVRAVLQDGRTLHLILKDLTSDRLLDDALGTKPGFLYEPRRCIETYRRLLSERDIGATFIGAFTDDAAGRYWFLVEKVAGVELWQVGDRGTWASVARWLARFHTSFSDEGERVAERNPYLLRYDPDYLRIWPARALAVAARRGLDDESLRALQGLAAQYEDVVVTLAAVPQAFIHGELYPSNVLVGGSGEDPSIWPIDWEMAGVGPQFLDLAALTAGWDGEEQARLVGAYLDELGSAGGHGSDDHLRRVLDCCRLHYALQWLGWSTDWSPPAEHARDWVSEALIVGERLGL